MYIAPVDSPFFGEVNLLRTLVCCEDLLFRLCEHSDLAAGGGISGSGCTVKVRMAS